MKRPTDDQLLTASEWLLTYEGSDQNARDCLAVAQWLDFLVDESVLREVAREHGLSVAEARRRLRRSRSVKANKI